MSNAEKIAQIDKKLNDLRDRDKKLYEIDESKLDLSDYEIAQKFGLAGESSFIDKGKSVIDTIFNFFDPYLDSTIMDADKIKNAEQAKVIANARTKINEALAQGKEPQRSDFSLQEQYQLYLSGYAGSDLGEKYADVANLTMKDKKIVDDFIQKGIDNYKKELEIANTDYDKLTDEQRQWLYDKSGVFNRGWDRVFKDDDEETLQQSYNIIKGGALMKIASERAQSVQNFAKTHNLAWLGTNYVFGSDKRFDKEYQNYLDDVEGIALDLQFDGIDKSGQYFYKTDENGNTLWFKLDDGFFNNLGNMFKDNAFSILGGLGGVVGGVWAARKGKAANATRGIVGGLGETGGAVLGSFVGSTAGGVADYINYALSNGKDIDFSQMITHATQEGLFSLVADGVAVGLSKLANTKGAKALFAPVTKAAHGVDTLIRKSPILGTIYSMPRNFFKGQNIEAAEELVLRYYTPEQRADIENALKELGGGLNIGASNNLLSKNSQFVADKLAQKYGSESSIAKTAQGFADAINMKGFKERQARLLQFVISDESGKNLGYVLEIAGKSPEVAKNLENIVRYSGLQLENALKKLDLPENQFKAVFKEFEKGTEQSFDEAMKLIGEQIFDGKVYKTKIDKAPFDDFLKAMSDEKIYMGDAEKRFVKEIIEPLFDENGVTFSQLNNIRKELNSKFKDIQSPTFKDYLRGQVGKKLREAVDRGINDIFRQNPRAYAKVKELYDTALKEYSTMKDIQTIIKKHNFHKEETDFAKDLNKLLKFIIDGKGNEKVPNLERILGQLTPQNRAVAEVNILKQMLENTKITLKQQFGRGQTRTFFTWDFIDNLDALAKRGNVFQSKAAQDFIKIVKDWHKLNKNHADILFSLKPADVKGVRQGIATRIQGRLEQMRTNLLMSNMFRLLDKIPFANALWDKTQAGALRFHIKNALSNSISIDDFRLKLLNKVETGNFDNNTKKIIREIIGEADNAEKTLTKMDEMENEILSLSDDELIKKEMENTFGVVYKGENATLIYKDLQNIQNAILLQKGDKNKGATHIRLKHTLDNNQQGFVTPDEVQKIGQNVRKYLKEHKEPFIDKDGARLYEWKDEKGVNFRLVVRDKVSGADTHPTSANEEIITFYSNRNLKDNTKFDFKNPQVEKSAQSQATPQAPAQEAQKSLLDLAREETQRLKQAQIDKELAQKEAEIARLKEMKAQQEQIIAQKESKAGLSANEAQRLEIGNAIPTKLLKPTKIIVNDSAQPFEADFVIAKKSDIKPNFERTGTQGRSEKQSKVIDSIQSDFKPHLIFEQSGGFEGLPIITKDGQVIAGNHRAEAINALSGEQLARYKQAAKEKFSVDLDDDEVIVRLVSDKNEKDLINLAFMSNVGRESNLGEKALSNLAKFEKEMPNLPNHIEAQSVDELQNIIAKTLDKQGGGLNTFDTNLALFSKLAKNSKNNDILDALNKIQNLSAEEKSKILKMFVDNAGSFHNLAKDADLKNLDLRPYLNDSLVVAANSYATRAEDYARLLGDIEHILSLSEAGLKETLALDKNLFENLKSKALGLSLARFARLENPSSQLFDFLKNAKANLEELNSANLFDSTGKKLDELDIYDFLKHSIAQGRENDDALKIIGKLDELREVEKRALKGESGKAVEATPSAPASKEIIDESGLKLDKARQILKENVNFEALNDEQKGIFEVFTGQKDRIILQGKDINDLYTLEQGSRNAGAKKILIKHAGVEKTGGLSNDELLNMMKVVREGELDKDSFVLTDNKMRYAYDLNKDGVKLRLVVDEYNDGRKVFDYYSDRNFTDYGQNRVVKMQKQQENLKQSQATPKIEVLAKQNHFADTMQSIDTQYNRVFSDEMKDLSLNFIFKAHQALEALAFSLKQNAKDLSEKEFNEVVEFISSHLGLKQRLSDELLRRYGLRAENEIMQRDINNFITKNVADGLKVETKPFEYKTLKDTFLSPFDEITKHLNEAFAARNADETLKSVAPKRNELVAISVPKENLTRYQMRQNAYQSLKEVEKTPLTNANDGRVAYLNKAGRQESLSDFAIKESEKNGFDAIKHLQTAQHLPELYENAVFRETTPDLKHNDKNVRMHRYTANFTLDGEPAQAKITLKETIDGKNAGNRIYTLQLESVSRLNPAEPQNPREALSAINDPKSSGFGEPSTKPDEIIPKTTNKSQIDERTNPNILMANQHLGAGLLGGTINGLETDENGNVIGFSPEKFVAGFLGGAGASKATQFALKNPKIRAKADKFLKESGEFIVRELRDENLSAQARQGLERLFGKALVRAMDSRAFIIAGENAIGANKAKLAHAKTLQKAGKSDDEIWLKTGWYEDKDGKWKFEINPQGGKFKKDIEWGNTRIKESGKLSDFLSDDELFEAYPQLKDYNLKIEYMGNTLQGRADKDTLVINNLFNETTQKRTLYHEIQHAVQDIENFARGGNLETAYMILKPNDYSKHAYAFLQKYKDFDTKNATAEEIKQKSDDWNFLKRRAYDKLHGEVEARNVETKMRNLDILKHMDDNPPEFDTEVEKLLNDEFHRETFALTQAHPHKTMDERLEKTFVVQRSENASNSEKVEIPIKVKKGDFKTLQTQLDKKLNSLKGTQFVNDETGIKASLGSSGIGEMIANVKDSVKNGFNFAEHFAVAMDLENVFKKAKYQGKAPDTKHGDPNVSIHRFKTQISFGKKRGKAKLTLKEWRENGKKFYALKLENLEKV